MQWTGARWPVLTRPELPLPRIRFPDRLHLRERIVFDVASVKQPAPTLPQQLGQIT